MLRLLALFFILPVLLAGRAVLAGRVGTVSPTNQWIDIYSLHSTGGGQPLAVGDYIAIFDSQGTQCGEFTVHTEGQFGLAPCYGDDSNTPEDEGAVSGDILHFTVNGVAASVTTLTHNRLSVDPDTPVRWEQHGDRWQVDLHTDLDGQIISLLPGWTLISFRLQPASTAVADVMQPVAGAYDHILGEEGSYDTHIPPLFNTLHTMEPGRAYWLHVLTPATLTISGPAVAPNTPLALHESWNWIGYLPADPLPVTEALASIDGLYTRVIGNNGSFDASIPPSFNTLQEMRPGEGYLLYMTQAATHPNPH
jgi:hypothetical protein